MNEAWIYGLFLTSYVFGFCCFTYYFMRKLAGREDIKPVICGVIFTVVPLILVKYIASL